MTSNSLLATHNSPLARLRASAWPSAASHRRHPRSYEIRNPYDADGLAGARNTGCDAGLPILFREPLFGLPTFPPKPLGSPPFFQSAPAGFLCPLARLSKWNSPSGRRLFRRLADG